MGVDVEPLAVAAMLAAALIIGAHYIPGRAALRAPITYMIGVSIILAGLAAYALLTGVWHGLAIVVVIVVTAGAADLAVYGIDAVVHRVRELQAANRILQGQLAGKGEGQREA